MLVQDPNAQPVNSYLKLCTEFYDIDKPEPPPDAFQFYLRHARAAHGRVLELMCGSGRFLAPLVAQGVLIDGADASLHMLRACERRCQARALTTSLYQQLAHRLDLPHRYDLVIVPSGSFSLLIDANHARECLRRLFEHLLPGGRVVMEVEQYTGQLTGSGPWGGRWVDRPDGARILCSWLSRFNAAERISYGMGRYELIQNGRLLDTELEEFNLRFYEQDEFRSMLDAAGFANVQAHKAYGPDLPDSVDETLVFEAVRPAG